MVSVIIPCYNLGQYLDEAVDSVLAQTYQSFEIIVVDDGSTDPFTRQLLANYGRPQTRVLHAEHGGVMRARNLGIEAATGEYLCALDADDKLDPSYFAKATRILDGDESITFVSCWLRTFGDEDWVWKQDRCDLPALLGECTVATPSLVRRSAVLAVGGFDVRMPEQGYEDWDLWISLLEAGFRGTIIPEILFFYRRRGGSVSRACERPETHLLLMRYMIDKHRDSYQRHLFELLLRKEAESDDLLRAAYALERQFQGSVLPVIDLRRHELQRRQARLETGEEAQRWAASLAQLEHDVIRECENRQRLAREHAERQQHAVQPEPAANTAAGNSASWGITARLRAIYDWSTRGKRASAGRSG